MVLNVNNEYYKLSFLRSETATAGLHALGSNALHNLVLSLNRLNGSSLNGGSLNSWLSIFKVVLDHPLRHLHLLGLQELLLLDFFHALFLSGSHVGHRCVVDNPDSLSFNLIGKGDEFGHFDLNQWTVNLVNLFIASCVDLVGLGDVISRDNLSNSALFEEIEFLRAANAAAEWEYAALGRVPVGGRVSDAKGAVHTMAVLEVDSAVMAGFAEVSRTPAVVESDRAAELALKVNLSLAMLFTVSLASTELLKEAVLADEVFLLGLVLFHVHHLLFAVDQATEVGLLAGVALVDRAAFVGVSLRLVVVVRAGGCNLFVHKDALILSTLKSKFLSFILQTNDRA